MLFFKSFWFFCVFQVAFGQLSSLFGFGSSAGQTCGTTENPGSCSSLIDCGNSGGYPHGECQLDSSLICCVPFATCGQTVSENETYFSSSHFPQTTSRSADCSIRIKKLQNAEYLKVDMVNLELAPPDEQGRCVEDSLTFDGLPVTVTQENPKPICGVNNGQHAYFLLTGSGPFVSVHVRIGSSANIPRRWLLKISQIEADNPSAPFRGCRQFFDGTEGDVYSFNYDIESSEGRGNIHSMDYGVCFKPQIGYCQLQLTPVFFMMNNGAESSTHKRSMTTPTKSYIYPIVHFMNASKSTNMSKLGDSSNRIDVSTQVSETTTETPTTLPTTTTTQMVESTAEIEANDTMIEEDVDPSETVKVPEYLPPLHAIVESLQRTRRQVGEDHEMTEIAQKCRRWKSELDDQVNGTLRERVELHCKAFFELEKIQAAMDSLREVEARMRSDLNGTESTRRLMESLLDEDIDTSINEIETEFALASEGVQAVNCDEQDMLILPPTKGVTVYCGKSFNNGQMLEVFTAPMVIHVRNMASRGHGLGFHLKYKHVPCSA